MSHLITKQLDSLTNSELATVLDNLKTYLKINLKERFDLAIKELDSFKFKNHTPKTYDDSTLDRYRRKLLETIDKERLLLERSYVCSLVEKACKRWNLELKKNNEFTKAGGTGANSSEPFRFEGNYYIYYPTSKEDAISKHPLNIDEKGVARIVMSGISGKDSRDVMVGEALYDGNSMLSIIFTEHNGRNKFRHYLFSVLEEFPPNNLAHAFGVSIRPNHDKRPLARMEILVYTVDNVEHPTICYKEFLIKSIEYLEEDLKLGGLLNWLTGKYNRMVTAPAKPNRKYSRRMVKEYVNIHFQAACYLGLKGDFEECLMNLYQAYLHGFSDMQLMEKEIGSGGCLEKVYQSTIKGGTRHSKKYHDPLTCKELVERIRERAKHINQLPENPKDS